MSILNYTTQIKSHKTVGEIQQILARAGALSVSIDYDNCASPVALTFFILVKDNPVNFRLPTQWEGVLRNLEKDKQVPKSLRNEDQARRVAWRIIKDWVEAQIAIIDAHLASLPEVFLPYAVTNSGLTVYQQFENNQLLLSEGPREPDENCLKGEITS